MSYKTGLEHRRNKGFIAFFVVTLSLEKKSDMDNQTLARRANRDEDYTRLGLKRGEIQQWEDGMRTSGGPGSFEWWYFDSHLGGGTSLAITFNTKWMLDAEKPEAPQITVDLNCPGKPERNLMLRPKAEDFIASKDKCDIQIKDSYFRGDLHHYEIKVVDESLVVEVQIDGQVPSWRPETGFSYFGERDEHYFAWLAAVPQGKVTATITEKGSDPVTLTGIGYHDHNWGNAVMSKLLNHWYWGRAQAGPYSTVSAHMYAEEAYGRGEWSVFMLAKEGKIVADSAPKVTFLLEDEFSDEKSRKPVANKVIYDYTIDDQNRYRVTFQRNQTLLDYKFIDKVKGFKHVLARMAKVDGAYLRFTGNVTVERYAGNQLVERASDPGIWELMYFGHVE
jgi:hypothetical protein